jgi:hypothetical protein
MMKDEPESPMRPRPRNEKMLNAFTTMGDEKAS